MTRSRMITWTAALLGLSLLLGGCGAPPPEQSTSTKSAQPAQGQPSQAQPTEMPTKPASAIWGGAIELTAYDVRPLGNDQYKVLLQFKCLKAMKTNWAQLMHLVPANRAALSTPGEQQYGIVNWDAQIEPATSTWQPGKTYLTARSGMLSKVGAPWKIQFGMVELLENRMGGKIKEVPLIDAGGMQKLAGTQMVVLATISK